MTLYHGFQAVIGLEVHAQIATRTKLFSAAPADVFGQPANACVGFVDVAMPGMLPVINQQCIYQAIKLGLAVGGSIRTTSVFERKHYFYPDNPAGYQISQYKHPLVEDGSLTIRDGAGQEKVVRLQRIHVEQDAGKSLHDQDPSLSYVDFNRAGVGLMEIVSHADMTGPEDVVAYVKTLQALVRRLGVCAGDMEKGHLRVDANISVHKPGTPWGTRVELKNMNSTRFLGQAVAYEIQRQIQVLQSGQTLVQETRTYDPATHTTRSMRLKESDTDYFYIPDPDLPVLIIDPAVVQALAMELPETPRDQQARYVADYGLSAYEAGVLAQDWDVSALFEQTLVHVGAEGHKLTAQWILGEVMALANKRECTVSELSLCPKQLAGLMNKLAEKSLSHTLAKEVFAVMLQTGQSADAVMHERGLVQISDPGQIQVWVDRVVADYPAQVQQYRGGKMTLLGFFVGQIMRLSGGKANPSMVQERITKTLEG